MDEEVQTEYSQQMGSEGAIRAGSSVALSYCYCYLIAKSVRHRLVEGKWQSGAGMVEGHS